MAYQRICHAEDQDRYDHYGGGAERPERQIDYPLQFEQYLTMALEEGYKVGQKPVGVDVIDAVLAKDIDSLEPRLTRHGYNVKPWPSCSMQSPVRSVPSFEASFHPAELKSSKAKCGQRVSLCSHSHLIWAATEVVGLFSKELAAGLLQRGNDVLSLEALQFVAHQRS